MKYLTLILIISYLHTFSQPQKTSLKKYKVAVAGFYNCENFFDTIRNPVIKDADFTPEGEKHYTSNIYRHKVGNLAKVLSELGTDFSANGAAFIGVAEIENDTVLNDLIQHPLLQSKNYQYIHYNSRDPRGIDVALLYNPKYFTIIDSKPIVVNLPRNTKEAWFTRDILWVKGQIDGETIHIFINHWPSRLGGERKSAAARAAAALVCKQQILAIQQEESNAKILVMGDLNDDPTSPSVTEVLDAKGDFSTLTPNGLYNPWVNLYKQGIGTLAFKDSWGLFDQIILSAPWLDKTQNGFFYYQPHIFNKPYLVENEGKYKGYPMRTWDGNNYRGGFSDHFATYLVFLKRK